MRHQPAIDIIHRAPGNHGDEFWLICLRMNNFTVQYILRSAQEMKENMIGSRRRERWICKLIVVSDAG